MRACPGILSRRWRPVFWIVLAGVGLAFFVSLAMVGGDLLLANDDLPGHADAIVVLAGSGRTSPLRHDAAVRLWHRGAAPYVVVSVRRAFYWGRWIPELARAYVEEKHGGEVLGHHVYCENDADSTAEEALALARCLEERGWQSVIVVTSDYHTRRARMIWNEVAALPGSSLTVAVRGVPDGDFDSIGWWRERRYAKTWVLEMSKLIWSSFEGLPLEQEHLADDEKEKPH